MITATPGAVVLAVLDGATPGQVGTLTYSVQTQDGLNIVAPTTAGIKEVVLNGVATGVYFVALTAPIIPGQYLITWFQDIGQGIDDLVVGDALRTSDATYADTKKPFVARLEGATTGLAGTGNVSAVKVDGTTAALETYSATIREVSPGIYQADLPSMDAGQYVLIWKMGGSVYCDPLYVGVTPIGFLI